MKKLICLFATVSTILTSCSNDSSPDSSAPPKDTIPEIVPKIFPKKIIEENLGMTYVGDFVYDGHKLVSNTRKDGTVFTFIYTGNLITKINRTDKEGTLTEVQEFTYQNEKLATSFTNIIKSDTNTHITYSPNNDGSISYTETRINKINNDQQITRTGKYTIKDGNLTKKEHSGYGFDHTTTYEYDTKNSPFKNVLGLKLLLDTAPFPSVNNIIKETLIINSITSIISYSYSYDTQNYPTEAIRTFKNGETTLTKRTQIFY